MSCLQERDSVFSKGNQQFGDEGKIRPLDSDLLDCVVQTFTERSGHAENSTLVYGIDSLGCFTTDQDGESVEGMSEYEGPRRKHRVLGVASCSFYENSICIYDVDL